MDIKKLRTMDLIIVVSGLITALILFSDGLALDALSARIIGQPVAATSEPISIIFYLAAIIFLAAVLYFLSRGIVFTSHRLNLSIAGNPLFPYLTASILLIFMMSIVLGANVSRTGERMAAGTDRPAPSGTVTPDGCRRPGETNRCLDQRK